MSSLLTQEGCSSLAEQPSSRVVSLSPDSPVSVSESITFLSLYDKLIRAARHVRPAAPPSWLFRYLPVGGSAAREQENPEPGACWAASLGCRLQKPHGQAGRLQHPGHGPGPTLTKYFLERALGLFCLKLISLCSAARVSEVRTLTLKYNEVPVFPSRNKNTTAMSRLRLIFVIANERNLAHINRVLFHREDAFLHITWLLCHLAK